MAKNATVKAMVEGVIEELMVRSNVENVYMQDGSTTLASKLAAMVSDIGERAKSTDVTTQINNAISELIGGAPETYDTLKEIADYIAENEEAVSALNSAIGNKANASDLLYSNATPVVSAHGGVAAGETFDEVPVTDMLTKILYPWVAPVVTAAVVTPSNGGVFEKGNTQTVTSVNVTVTKKSANITKVELYNGSTVIGTKSGSDLSAVNSSSTAQTLSFTGLNVSVSANQNLTAKVTDADGKVTSANTGTFSFVYPYYYGVIASGATADAATVKALTKVVQAKGSKALNFTASNQKMVFAAPAANGAIKTITDPNGFNVTDTFTSSTVSITGLDGTAQSYYVYTSDATTVSAFKMTFAH